MAHVRIVRDIYLSSFWVELHFSNVFFFYYIGTTSRLNNIRARMCVCDSRGRCVWIYINVIFIPCVAANRWNIFFCKNAHMCYLGYICVDATYMNKCLFVYLYFGFDMYEWWQQRAGGRSLYLTTYKTENKNKINMHKETKL